MTLSLHVTGMSCNGCENAIKRVIGQLDGVSDVSASHQDERVDVTFDESKVNREAIEQKIRRLGYGVAQA